MLDDLLNFGKPLKLNLSLTTFRDFAEHVVKLHKKDAVKKGIFLEISDGLGEQQLSFDIELIERALANLLTNAIYWSPQESTISIASSYHKNRKEWYSLAVSNTGPEIPPEQLKRVFMPFFTSRQDGTGLGLANVRKIVEHHGGTVTVDNHPNGGVVFTFVLPFKGI